MPPDTLSFSMPKELAAASMEFPRECAARFRPGRLLGAGGHGSVYAARQIDLDRPAAVKLLKVDGANDLEMIRRFEAEARITATLAHQNIVVVYDHGAGDGQPWIAYELIEGRTLRDELAEGALPLARAVKAALAIAAALEHAHAHGVLHRDIKPDNVFALTNGNFKVADFGIAKWSQAGAVMTKTGVILATPHYVAPEQVQGQPASTASDLYALGAVLFELLAGRPPYVGATLMATLDAHIKAPVPSLAKLRPDVPPQLDAVCRMALAKRPADRPADAGALRAQLEACRRYVTDDSFEAAPPLPATLSGGTQAMKPRARPAAHTATIASSISRGAASAPARPRWWWVAVPALAVPILWYAQSKGPPIPIASVTSSPSTRAAPPHVAPEPYTPVEDLLVRAGARDVLVDFMLLKPQSVRVVVGNGPTEIKTEPVLTTWFHRRIGGLQPEVAYRLDVLVGESGRGVRGYHFRTRRLAEETSAKLEIDGLDGLQTGVADLSLGAVGDYPHPALAPALGAILARKDLGHFLEFRQLAQLARHERDRPLAEKLLAVIERIPAADDVARGYAMDAATLGHAPKVAEQAQRWLFKPPAGSEFSAPWLSACARAINVSRVPDAADLLGKFRETGPPPGKWNEPQLPLWMIRTNPEVAREYFQKWLTDPPRPGGRRPDLRPVGVAGLSYLNDGPGSDALMPVARAPSTTDPDLWARAVEALGGSSAPGARDRVTSLLATHRTSPPIPLLWAATRQDCPAVIPHLERALTDPSASSARRTQAAACLSYLGKGGHDALSAALTRVKEPDERRAIVLALLAQSAPEGVDAARSMLDTCGPDDAAAIAFGLARARDSVSAPRLEKRLRELAKQPQPDEFLGSALLAAYAEVAGEAARPLLEQVTQDGLLGRVPREQAKRLLEQNPGRTFHLIQPSACFQRSGVSVLAGQAVTLVATGQWGSTAATTLYFPYNHARPEAEVPELMLNLEARIATRVMTVGGYLSEIVMPADGEIVFTAFGGEAYLGCGARVRDESERRRPLRGSVLVMLER